MWWTVHLEGGPMRVNHAAVCIGNNIFSFGGYCSSAGYNDWDPISVHILDTCTLRWKMMNYANFDKISILPFQRYGHITVAYNNKVYMWGGRNNKVACNTLFCFNTETLEWSKPPTTGQGPFAKDGHSACVIKNKLYIFGGFEYFGNQFCQKVHCLNLDTFVWNIIKTKGTPPLPRDFHTAVAVGDRMYVFGGRGDLGEGHTEEEVYCSIVHYLDTTSSTWHTLNPSGIWPEGRRSHSSWLHNGYMYIFGGYNGNTETHFNDLHRYSIQKNCWEPLTVKGSVPNARRRQSCLVHKDKVYLFGGTSPSPNVAYRDDMPDMLQDNSDLHILDYSVSLKTLCILKVVEHKLDFTSLPRDIILDVKHITVPNRISRPNPTG